MTQLVELQKHLAKFDALDVQVIGLLRNEKLGVEGLKLAKEKTKATFLLAYDVKAKTTARYAPRFTTYLIDKSGTIRAVLGPKDKKPVKPSVIIEAFEKLQKGDSKSGTKNSKANSTCVRTQNLRSVRLTVRMQADPRMPRFTAGI